MAQAAAEASGKPRRACILLWMNGGPSQMDTWDLKPGHANGGPIKEIDTKVPGLRISEHLPKLAARVDKLAVIRGMSTKEADHGRGSYLMRTGRAPGGPVRYPAIGSFVGKELDRPDAELPSVVSIAPFRFLSPEAYGPGFLGPRYAPLVVAENASDRQNGNREIDQVLKVQDLDLPEGVTEARGVARADFRDSLDDDFLADHPGAAGEGRRTAYRRANTFMRSSAVKAFDLSEEKPALRDKYGRSLFGQGCLLARRLVERGVPFVEASLGGWDTHDNNFKQVQSLCQTLDPAWSTLLVDLRDRGLLDSTTIVWLGEFGRTPGINPRQGRDHYPNAWSVVLGGGGIRGGCVVGKTNGSGLTVEDRPVTVPDLLATICLALGIDPEKQNMSNVNRPIRIVDSSAKPIREILA